MIDFGVVSGSTGESLALGHQGGASPAATSVGAVDFAAVMSDMAAASLGTSDNLSALDAASLVATDDAPRATIASSRELTALLEQIAARLAAKDGNREDGDQPATDLLAGTLDAKPLSDVRSPLTPGVATASQTTTDTGALTTDSALVADGAVEGEAGDAPGDPANAPATSDDDSRYAPPPGRDEIRRILAATAPIDEPAVPAPPAVAADGNGESGQPGRNPFLPLARLIDRIRADAAEAGETSAPSATTAGSMSIVNGTLTEAGAASSLMFRTASPAPLTTTASFSDESHADASNTVSIVQAIRLQWSHGAGEARIQLEPEQFGALTVTLRVVQGQVIARVESDTATVREWLKSNQDVLHDALADRELTLEHLEIAEPEESSFSRDERSRDEAPAEQHWHPRRWRRPDTGVQFEVVV